MPSLHDQLQRFRDHEWRRKLCDWLDTLVLTPGPQGEIGLQGIQGVAGLLASVTPSTPARALNTVFQPSATKITLVTYSVRITCTATIGGNQDGKVELLSDASNPPTTVRAMMSNRMAVTLALTLQAINEQTSVLTALVPAGHYVKLLTTQITGTPAFALVSQTEVALN